LRVIGPQGYTDVDVACDATAEVGQVAGVISGAGPGWTLVRVDDQGQRVSGSFHPGAVWSDCGLASGATVAVVSAETARPSGSAPVVQVEVVAGPDAGLRVDLPTGVHMVGRDADCEVRLSGHDVSSRHARLVIRSQVQIVDEGSLNGVEVDGGPVDRAVVEEGARVRLATTELAIRPLPGAHDAVDRGPVSFTRCPQVVPRFEEREIDAPAPPRPPGPNRFPVLAMIAPLLMGITLFAVTRSPLSLVFIGLSPLLMLGTWADRAWRDRSESKTRAVRFTEALDGLVSEVETLHVEEHQVRTEESPDIVRVLDAIARRSPLLWSRAAADDDFLSVHLGLGTDASRVSIKVPPRADSEPEEWARLTETVDSQTNVDQVPVLVSVTECGAFGIAGPAWATDNTLRALLLQLVGLCSPAELTLCVLASPRTGLERWDWVKWLPHVDGLHAPLPGPHVAMAGAPARALLTRLEELVAARTQTPNRAVTRPAVVVVVDDDTVADRARLVRLAAEGPSAGIHVVWCAPQVARLPAACGAFADMAQVPYRLGTVHPASWRPLSPPSVLEDDARRAAMCLAGVVDAGAPVLDESDLPRAVPWLSLVGARVGDEPRLIADRWKQTAGGTAVSLRAVVGVGADGPFVLDLADQGPHALVGGTTGSGKSEFLQTWVVALAAAYAPGQVTFLLVDYKGGSAFGDTVRLPHCVGLVTDLTPHLVRRALTSLRAELHARERTLARVGAKDLDTMRKAGHADAPPALVIVVDEFAALAGDVPEFVDGMIDIAQRGRSLGLHLVLATQRPAGVIKDNLRANTNLRVALRMADEQDSTDVLGSPQAARFDPSVPGRAAVRTGPGRVALFQTGYLGGRTTPGPRPAQVEVSTLGVGPATVLAATGPAGLSDVSDTRPPDLTRLVTTIRSAAEQDGLPAPRRPWLPELDTCYDLAALPAPDEPGAAFAMADLPSQQVQRTVGVDWDARGSVAVFGGPGAGVSTTLRTLTVSTLTGQGTTWVYGVDAGAGGLGLLRSLPGVGAVIDLDDRERLTRLVDLTCARLDERAERFAAAHASTLSQYRQVTETDEPRVLLVIDGVAALRETYENDLTSARLWAGLTRIIVEGRSLGVHVAVGLERPNGMPTSWASAVGLRLVLRHTDATAYQVLGVPADVLSPDSPPGRGVLAGNDGAELQVAVPGGTPDLRAQADAALALVPVGRTPPPAIPRLPVVVTSTDLPDPAPDEPIIGLGDSTDTAGRFLPVTFTPTGTFMLAGGPGSGRTTALEWLSRELARACPDHLRVWIGPQRSPLRQSPHWTDVAASPEEATTLLTDLSSTLTGESPRVVLVIEGLPELISTTVEQPLLETIRAARRAGHLVIAEAETSAWGSGWPLVAEIRNVRRGLVLQPDQVDGDALFRLPFPRGSRADYPPGRGLLVEACRITRVQVPVPEDTASPADP